MLHLHPLLLTMTGHNHEATQSSTAKWPRSLRLVLNSKAPSLRALPHGSNVADLKSGSLSKVSQNARPFFPGHPAHGQSWYLKHAVQSCAFAGQAGQGASGDGSSAEALPAWPSQYATQSAAPLAPETEFDGAVPPRAHTQHGARVKSGAEASTSGSTDRSKRSRDEHASGATLPHSKAQRRFSEASGPSRAAAKPALSSLLGRLCSKPVHACIVGGELLADARTQLRRSPALLHGDGWAQLPEAWTEKRISVVEPGSHATGMTRTRYDKAFCVEWIGNDTAAVSTKCGHILQVDRRARTLREVELEGHRCALQRPGPDATTAPCALCE